MLICISREYRSGGHEIGRMLANALGYSCYDQYILSEAMKLSAISISKEGEKSDRMWESPGIHNSYSSSKRLDSKVFPLNDANYQLQSSIIQKSVAKNSCVYVGLCADAILKEVGIQRISLFIASPFADRLQRIMKLQNLEENMAAELVCRTDRHKKIYYNYYTEGGWGLPDHYDLCINSSMLGIEKTADALLTVVSVFSTTKSGMRIFSWTPLSDQALFYTLSCL